MANAEPGEKTRSQPGCAQSEDDFFNGLPARISHKGGGVPEYVDYIARFERVVLAFELVGVGALGLLWGSFLNVCIYRLPIYRLVFYPSSSFCPTCGRQIRWRDNIPVLSYLVLRGRCRHCGKGISPRYLLVEILTAAVMVAAVVKLSLIDGRPPGFVAIQCAVLSALIVATFTDLQHTIIPDEISLGGAILAPIVSLLYAPLHQDVIWFASHPHLNGLVVSLVSAGIGAGVIYLIGVLGKIAFRKEAMGLGDVKLMAFLGGVLGYKAAVLTIFAGAFITLFYILIYVVLLAVRYGVREVSKRGSEVPFGPGLCTAAALAIFFRSQTDGVFDHVAEMIRFIIAGAP